MKLIAVMIALMFLGACTSLGQYKKQSQGALDRFFEALGTGDTSKIVSGQKANEEDWD
jgi:hypothetical protein